MQKGIIFIFQIFRIVSVWSEKALADGKVTLVEAVALAVSLAGLLGVRIEIDMDGLLPRAANEVKPESAAGVEPMSRGPPDV